jgi:hypothetical protein
MASPPELLVVRRPDGLSGHIDNYAQTLSKMRRVTV